MVDHCSVVLARETSVTVREIDRRAPLSCNCGSWARNRCAESDWPNGQTFHSNERKHWRTTLLLPKMLRTHWVLTLSKQKRTLHEGTYQEDNRNHGTQANTNSILGITEKTRVRIAGNQSMCPKKRERGFNQNWHLIGLIGVCVLASEKPRWASVERTGPNIMSFLHMEIERWHPPSWSFRFHDANTSICISGPSLKHIASFAWCGTNFGKMRMSGFELRQAEVQNRDCKCLSCETCYLVCMKCDSRGFSLSFNSQFPGFSIFRRYSLWAKAQASMKHITKIPYWTLGKNKNDQVTEKMASPQKRRSTTPNTYKRLYNRRHSLWWERESRSSGQAIRQICASLRREILGAYKDHCRSCVRNSP